MIEPLYDHEVRDIMGRQKNPEIVIEFDRHWKQVSNSPTTDEKKPSYYMLNIYANNVGKVYAKYINVMLTLPQRCLQVNSFDRNNQSTGEVNADNKVRDLVAPNAEHYLRTLTIAKPPEYGPARYEPVLPGMRMLIKSIPIHEYSADAGNELTWIMYADNSEPKTGVIECCNIKRL
jgi:hypothetical protein